MCNLYSITTNQAAIIALFRVINRYFGNLPPMPGVFPDYPAPVIRNTDSARELGPPSNLWLIGTGETVYLPTGTGVFVGHVIGGITTTGRPKIYYRARTWLPAAWLNADQQPPARRWRRRWRGGHRAVALAPAGAGGGIGDSL